MIRVVPLSCCRKSCVLRAIRAEKVGRQRERLVERIGVQRLRMALRRRHRLDAGDDVVEHVRAVRPAAGLTWCAAAATDGFRLETLDELRPQQARARSFATSMKKFMPIAQKNESRGAN